MPVLERASKTAATASVLLILALMLLIHPDVTWLLRGLGVAALVSAWFVPRLPLRAAAPAGQPVFWLFVAAVAPALLRLLAGREGPVLDLVWMAGLAGSLLRTAPWSRWTLPFPWGVLIGGWTLALSLAWPVLVARELGFHLSALHDAGAINSWSALSAPQAAVWILYVVLAQLLGALWFERAWEQSAEARSPILLNGLWAGATMASVVAVLQGTIDLGFLSSGFWASLGRATGTMLDANAYGMCAALAAPVGFLGLRALAPRNTAGAVAVFVVNLAGVWLSGSRTALLCAVIGAAALAFGMWRERSMTPLSRGLVVWIPAGVVVLLAVLLLTDTTNPIRRALDIPSGRAGLASLWDRGGYGPIALRMTREHPLTGVGVGSYRILAPDYWRAMADEALPPDNAQNWWRHQIAELGVLGGALVMAFSVLVAWRVLAARALAGRMAAACTARGALFGLGVISLVGMPTQSPLVLLWFFALVAWLPTLVAEPIRRGATGPVERAAWVVAVVLAAGYAAGHLLLAAGPLHPRQRAAQAHRDYVIGAYASEPLPGSNEFRWTGEETQFFWSVRSRWMVVRFWANHPDITARPVHVRLTSPCGVLFDEDLNSDASMSLGLALPEGLQTLEATVHVSRTWSPAEAGDADARRLGVGIVADFSNDPAFSTNQLRSVNLSACAAGI